MKERDQVDEGDYGPRNMNVWKRRAKLKPRGRGEEHKLQCLVLHPRTQGSLNARNSPTRAGTLTSRNSKIAFLKRCPRDWSKAIGLLHILLLDHGVPPCPSRLWLGPT